MPERAAGLSAVDPPPPPPPPRAPTGLGRPGRALWKSLTKVHDFDPDELALLEQACRMADDRARLEKALADTATVVTGSQGQPVVNGLFSELRLNRQAQARLLGQLALERDDDSRPLTAKQRQTSRAAQSRWSRTSETRALRRGQAG